MTIENDDTATITVNDITGEEAALSAGSQTVTYTLSAPIDAEIAGTLGVNDDTAVDAAGPIGGDDYDVTSGTGGVTFQSGGDTADVVLAVNDDVVVELDESLTVDLSSLTVGGVALGSSEYAPFLTVDTQAVVTIENDDTATITVTGTGGGDDITGSETDLSGSPQTITYTLSGPIDAAITGLLSVNDGTATETGPDPGDDDYDVVSVGTVNLQDVGDSVDATFTVNNDTVVERHETFTVDLTDIQVDGVPLGSSPYAGLLDIDTQSLITILNDDAAVVNISADQSADEGDVGPTSATYTVTSNAQISSGSGGTFTSSVTDGPLVGGARDGGTGVGSNDYDVTGGSDTVGAFWDGAATNLVTVDINGDLTVEQDETFGVEVTALPGDFSTLTLVDGTTPAVTFGDATATHTILNDDGGDGGGGGGGGGVDFEISATTDGLEDTAVFSVTVQLNVEVELYGAGDLVLNVHNDLGTGRTADHDTNSYEGTDDYVAETNLLYFDGTAAGQTQTAMFVVHADSIVEIDEVFNVSLSENDFQGHHLTVSTVIQPLNILNDDSATVTHLNTLGPQPEDLGSTFRMELSNPVQTATFLNDVIDDSPRLVTNFSSGNALAGDLDPGQQLASIDDGPAAFVGDNDYEQVAASWQYRGGDALFKDITVDHNQDVVVELEEIFRANYSEIDYLGYGPAGSNEVVLDTSHDLGVITQEDAATISLVLHPSYATSPTTGSITEGTNASNPLTFGDHGYTIVLSDPVQDYDGTGFVVDNFTVDGTATEASGAGAGLEDYQQILETTTFDEDVNDPAVQLYGAAAQSANKTVFIRQDDTVELDENFTLKITENDFGPFGSSGTGQLTLENSVQTITIVNDDSITVSVNSVVVNEADATATVSVSLSEAVDVPVSVTVSTADNTATAGSDYTAKTEVITFPASSTAPQDFVVTLPADDSLVEMDEIIDVLLSNLQASGREGSIGLSNGTITITDNDLAQISINDVSILEGDTGVSTATLTVTLDTAVDVPVDVEVNTVDGTAIAGDLGNSGDEDYVAIAGGGIQFAGTAGETKQITVTANGDQVVELDEVLNVVLSDISASGREADITFADNTGTVTIENDDSATVSIQEIASANESAGTIDLVVALSSPVDVNVTVDADDVEGTAKKSGANASEFDYNDVPGQTFTFSNVAGSPLEYTVTVEVNDDGIVELDETLQVVLSAFGGVSGRAVTLANDTADVTIENDDSAAVTINNTIVNEDDGTATLLVSLSQPVDVSTTVDWMTLDDTASSLLGDYTADSGQVVFSALSTTDQSITITIADDDIVELDEQLHVALLDSLAAGGRDVTIVPGGDLFTGGLTNVDASGSITILNNDSANLQIVADQAIIQEGDDGITHATLTVTLSNPVDVPILVNYFSANGAHNAANNDGTAAAGAPGYTGVNSTADNENPTDPAGYYDFVNSAQTENHDYDDVAGVLNFPAVNNGLVNGEITQTITLPIYGDEIVELDEWFSVAISASDVLGRSVTVDQTEDFIWIDNDDEAQVSIADTIVVEGTVGQVYAVLNVTLDSAVDVPVSVDYVTVDGTATSATTLFHGDEDYVHGAGTLIFDGHAGEVQEIRVLINGDDVVELDEYFEVHLSNLLAQHRDVTISDDELGDDGVGVVEIRSFDTASASIQITDVATLEGDVGTTTVTSVVILSAPVDIPVTATYATVDGTATAPTDYLATSGSVSFSNLKSAPRTFSIDVVINGDTDFELHEDFFIELGVLDALGRNVFYLDNDSRSSMEARIDIINDDRSGNSLIGPCNIVAEPGYVDLDGDARYAAWNVSFHHENDDSVEMDIQFVAAAAPGEGLEIGVPHLLDRYGNPIAAQKLNHVSAGDPTRSYGVYRVTSGDYTVVVPSGDDTDGLVELVVSMPGVLSETDEAVTLEAFQQTAAGVLQTQIGYGDGAAEVFDSMMDLDLAVDQYDPCLDADLNGGLTIFDLSSVDVNKEAADIPTVSLLEDRFNPAEILDIDPLGQPTISVAELFGFSLYHNHESPLDVNNDGHITPIDALVTINSLNDEGTRSHLVMGDELVTPQTLYFFDTNHDYAITPIDVLHVVNALNNMGAGEGEWAGGEEGEGESATDVIFGEYEGVTIQATDFDATVEALSVEVDSNETGEEYYTTPVQQSTWSAEIDTVLEDLGQEEQDLELDELLN